jgi:hypothetical protein
MILVEYHPTCAYRLFDHVKQIIILSTNVKVVENECLNWKKKCSSLTHFPTLIVQDEEGTKFKVIMEGETNETPRASNERINSFLAKASFHKCRMENGVYAKSKIAKTNFYIFFLINPLVIRG